MKQTYRTMMEQKTLSDDARTSFAEKLSRPKERRYPLRTALIAACLSTALVSTVFAVGYVTENGIFKPKEPKDVKITAEISGEDFSSYQLEATVSLRSGDALRPEVKEDLAAGNLPISFADADSLESYLGIPLLGNPLLDKAESVGDVADSIAHGWTLCPELAADPTARYLVSDASERIPGLIRITSHRVAYNTEVYIRAYLMTNEGESVVPMKDLPGEDFLPTPMIDSTLVKNENGEWEWITEHYVSANYRFTAEVYEMENGIEATVVTAHMIDRSGEESFREYAAYFVADGVLYSVRPYAVYDPEQASGRETDTSMLSVLRNVLDGFE